MADTGYFDSVSANLKTGVGAQVKGISEGVKANSEAGVSPSVNALDTGVKAAAAIGGPLIRPNTLQNRNVHTMVQCKQMGNRDVSW